MIRGPQGALTQHQVVCDGSAIKLKSRFSVKQPKYIEMYCKCEDMSVSRHSLGKTS